MHTQLPDESLKQIFTEARTYKVWTERRVTDELLHQIYDLCKWGPTSMNCCPMRLVFVRSAAAKEKLLPTLSGSNVDQVRSAPVTTIVAIDMKFFEQIPRLFPSAKNGKATFEGNPALTDVTALRNGSLQGAYFMLAARSLGLDCGPMSGFDNAKVDLAFLQGTNWKSNFLCNIGFADTSKVYPRGPRLGFDETCRVV